MCVFSVFSDKLWVLVSRASFTYAVLIILINISVQIAFIADVDAVTQRTLDVSD